MLEAQSITFSYGGGRTLYRDFSLSVASGERVALSAPSGFGKTTLCRLLAGYERPQQGETLIDGQPLLSHSAMRQHRARRLRLRSEGSAKGRSAARLAPRRGEPCPVQLIGQHPELALDPRMRMCDALAEAGIVEPYEGHENPLVRALGIELQWLSRYPHELSGGELQRFCIARALAVRPRYLVADEITTMLDAVTQAQIWEFLLSETKSQNMGLVFVSHSPALTKRIATRVVNLGAL